MSDNHRVAIVDYGMGNLFSVKNACERVGLRADITCSKRDILAAAAIVLPGVGAFGMAMENLRRLDLVGLLQEAASSPRPFLGVCLGMQLLMTESYEFGHHQGLGLIEGDVLPLPPTIDGGRRVKVPHVGWNRVRFAKEPGASSLLRGVSNDQSMYFVHSFYCRPVDPSHTLTTTTYGIDFCSSLQRGNITACQFHPERSGPHGLRIYHNLGAAMTAGSLGKVGRS